MSGREKVFARSRVARKAAGLHVAQRRDDLSLAPHLDGNGKDP